ncbi:MAG: hypothetical protein CVV33_03880 [Methanomicrobiales archaeon HGW-Methanomicrobiales-4]|nr:MAG: hypothetical protein CVV33_03880 [Methanomicrobiales archaeon HGW-Methanomicrobiales-4]
MKIVKTLSSTRISDGRARIEYRLSSPITREVLSALSQEKWVCTGYQYLSPTFVISKSDDIEIQGILHSPLIVLYCPPRSQFWIEEYLIELLSTIPDSERMELPFHRIIVFFSSRLRTRAR